MQGLTRILLGAVAAAALTAVVDWRLAPLSLVVVLITFTPLARRKRLWFVGDVESEFSIVSRRREEALRALKDLEDDKLAGKLPADEFDRLRPGYLQTAEELTTRLDALQQARAAAQRRIEQDLERSKTQA
jgi:hypothetical protein